MNISTVLSDIVHIDTHILFFNSSHATSSTRCLVCVLPGDLSVFMFGGGGGGGSRHGRHGSAACELTHQEVGLGRRLPEVLLDVLGLVGDHADEGVELDDCHTQVDQVDAVAQQGAQRREEVCRETQLREARRSATVVLPLLNRHFKSQLKTCRFGKTRPL